MMKKIIIDTNFLLLPSEFKVDIFTEIERLVPRDHKLYIIDGTIAELHKIIEGKNKSKDKLNAKIGLQLVEQKKIAKIESKGHVDDVIVDVADKDTIVATSDKELRRRLRAKKIKLISLRKKQYLVYGE
jgi:rRNA-processing protein FCF1